ncbi:unnamed protein product [Caretta caretta]
MDRNWLFASVQRPASGLDPTVFRCCMATGLCPEELIQREKHHLLGAAARTALAGESPPEEDFQHISLNNKGVHRSFV